jgi:hypothetical protein
MNDRNLLFGILALQMDFISRDGLIAAINAWVLDKAKTLADLHYDQNPTILGPEELLKSPIPWQPGSGEGRRRRGR